MEIRSEFRAETASEWEALWTSRPPATRLLQDLLGRESDPQILFDHACSFLGGVAMGSKFRLFRNGGLPVLERRHGDWTEEILFRRPLTSRPGSWVPLTVHLHLSCEGFLDVRKRYWSVLSRPPRVVASGNIGQLEWPEQRILWNLATGTPNEPVVELIADKLLHQAIPWFNAFANPSRLRQRLFEGGIALLDPLTALEWCLFEFGPGVASDYLQSIVLADEELREAVSRLVHRVDHGYLEGGPALGRAGNVAALAATYDLDV